MFNVESSIPSNKDDKKKLLKEAATFNVESSIISNKDNKKQVEIISSIQFRKFNIIK